MEFIKYETFDHIALITIDRPAALNALSSAVLDELDEAIDKIKKDIYCLIITGGGDKSFVAGADISEMVNYDEKQAFAYGKKGNDLFRKIETLKIPVIAAVNGFALGGGCELAMSCDMRIASDNAVFGQPEVGLGITPGFGGTQRLARLVSPGYAKQLIYSGRNIKADEALRIGLINAIYPQEELLDNAKKLANSIAANAPIAVANLNMDKAIALEEKIFGSCFKTKDQKEGMNAFLEKRKEKNFQNK